MKKVLLMLGVVAGITATLSFIRLQQENDPWNVPEKYKALKNPVKADKPSIKSGKELYSSYCKTCHGTDGKGDGLKAMKLNNQPVNLTTKAFQQHSDGALLYVIYTGHKEMPGFKKNLLPGIDDANAGTFGDTRSPGDLINYVRSLSAKPSQP